MFTHFVVSLFHHFAEPNGISNHETELTNVLRIDRRDAKGVKTKNEFKCRKNYFSINNSMDLLGLVGLTNSRI